MGVDDVSSVSPVTVCVNQCNSSLQEKRLLKRELYEAKRNARAASQELRAMRQAIRDKRNSLKREKKQIKATKKLLRRNDHSCHDQIHLVESKVSAEVDIPSSASIQEELLQLKKAHWQVHLDLRELGSRRNVWQKNMENLSQMDHFYQEALDKVNALRGAVEVKRAAFRQMLVPARLPVVEVGAT
mmetsp:Transcript_6815/g.11702  ORF Transcript_6815/g.11702 Transcript_6815/m.11702 type:complete len:186 (-) Transcript_6815:238-795(-)|eukprot:CAMPEP_0196656398 /NCGR_PEP_ID=MMETSP1086-20130531/16666_1 /TAXON_ID=77921 /ORGANISM="Cyanoptyche  gloeocystis , Strain SAG4.97" /LENGTH=185 /DNA_ID=CAMNT_0041989133 /DNA_START=100 /DNA_END=657 /DNA_ORIENTATION=-